MLQKTLDRLLRHYLLWRGYEVSRRPRAPDAKDYVVKGSFMAPDGSFDYAEYAAVQIAGNKRKFDKVWADRETIEAICGHLTRTLGTVEAGLCHGSRNGAEIRWFKEILGCPVIGTDISPTAGDVPDMVQWDFHDANPDWIGRFDFVYTNSHDHAYDPARAIATWVDQLKPNGLLVLEHSMAHSEQGVTNLDPFGIDPKVFPYVLLQWGAGRFAMTDMIMRPPTEQKKHRLWIFFIRRVPAVAG